MTVNANTWLYVVIQKVGREDQIVGQTDAESEIAYIPAFFDKETAQQAMLHLHLERKRKYEVQAMIYEDLVRHAIDDGFVIFVLDEDGNVLERLPGVA